MNTKRLVNPNNKQNWKSQLNQICVVMRELSMRLIYNYFSVIVH